MILFCWQIKKLRKKKSPRERCDTRGWNKEYMEKKLLTTEQLRKETQQIPEQGVHVVIDAKIEKIP